LIHGVSWIKSGRDINFESCSFNKIKHLIERELIEPNLTVGADTAGFKPTYGIWDGHGNRLGTMYNHAVKGFEKPNELTDETIKKVVELIETAYTFLKNNQNRIYEIISKPFNSQKV
ncbi:MAG: hypothetical protein K2H98_04960, partial [Duncaniella sp.]|nr:hypothetical protein [Duncaniella sp.]